MYSNYEMMKRLGQDRNKAHLAEAAANHQASVDEKSAGFQTILRILFHSLKGIRQSGSRPRMRVLSRKKLV